MTCFQRRQHRWQATLTVDGLAVLRELVVHPSYMLVYDVVGMQVRILSVVHTARQWPPSLG